MAAPPPVSAPPPAAALSANDQVFIELLTSDGYPPPQKKRRATVAGRGVCGSLSYGTTPGRVVSNFQADTGVPYEVAVAFTADAIAAYCPERIPR
ncbi:DUF732 domain-containing protein [Mycobacterium sp. 1274756.6]|uniref:DUF732 domain-containing protein n=1 Tax=Mycobacterium sp. 1274756.6 TaxID=1834076 RepID=UPI00336A84AA